VTSANTAGSIIKNLSTAAVAPGGSSATSESRANVAQSVFPLDSTGLSSYAFGTGLPGNTFVNSALAIHPNVQAAFSTAGALVLGTGAQGAHFANDAVGAHHFVNAIIWQLDTRTLSGHLLAGLLDHQSFGSGFSSLEFTIAKQGVNVTDDVFTTLGAAESFFNDRALDLGAFAIGSPLDLVFTFSLFADAVGQGFGENFLFGTAASAVPPPPVPAPDTLTLVVFAAVLMWMLHRRFASRCRRLPGS